VFQSDGVEINYIVQGSGPPVLLIHGFASSLHGNWRATGIVDALVKSGRKVVALDCRGHGRSGKPHDPEAYGGTKMADDAVALLDHLGIAKADLMGYSMGGGVSASLLVRKPERFNCVILAGIGDAMVDGPRPERARNIAAGMEATDASAVEDETARGFRQFAEQSGNDLGALAAMQRSGRQPLDPSLLSAVALPVMVLIGKDDTLVGKADKLAATIPGAKHVVVPGDHLTVFAHPEYTNEVLAFLADVSPV